MLKLVGGVERMSRGIGFADGIDGRALAQASGSLSRLAVANPKVPLDRMARSLVARGDLGRNEPRAIAAAEPRAAPEGAATGLNARVRETVAALPRMSGDRTTDLGLAALDKAAREGRCRAIGAAVVFEGVSRAAHAAGRADVADTAARAFAGFARQAQAEARDRAQLREARADRRQDRDTDAR